MSFQDITIKNNYRTGEDDVINDFLIPALKNSIKYKRAAGFFSSSALVRLSRGISGLIKNNGKMQLVVSPHLSKEDVDAISKGYENKEKIIEQALINSLNEELLENEKDRLNLMISLIENGVLDIKVAIMDDGQEIGMYHEKIGILEDIFGNRIAFTGSYNESENSYVNNFESLDVYSSLKSEFSRVEEKNFNFDKLWNNMTNKLQVIDFPVAVKDKLFNEFYNKLTLKTEEQIIANEQNSKSKLLPGLPKNYLRYYQLEAIENWKKNKFVGIFDMATGTGKTLTAIGASEYLLKELDGNLAIVIICPYTHLVEQWAEDLSLYNFEPIVGFGTSSNKRWKDELKESVLKFKIGLKKYFCFITTNATYTSDFVQEQLTKIQTKNVLFIADEAHNLGAPYIMSKLNPVFKFRLALSATFERFNDEYGTSVLKEYFGNYYAIHYSLRDAINNNMLTEYKYYPILTTLDDDELDEYLELTRQIVTCLRKNKKGELEVNQLGKMLLLKRARVVAGSKDKITKLIELLKSQKEQYGDILNTLIYCGATAMHNVEETDLEDIKQVDYVRNKIKSNLNVSVAKFTSTESNYERALIKEQFVKHEINAIVAIKCLDEGVNIPAINTAYILASSTNPREYVQRKGRVLRLAKGKDIAEIYDFITLPRTLDNARMQSKEKLKEDIGLVKRELTRLSDFAEDALNYADILDVRDKIDEIYGGLLYESKEEFGEW